MHYFVNLLTKRLLTNFGSNYLKASNSYSQLLCFHSLVFSKVMHKNFSINNCLNNNKNVMTFENQKLLKLLFTNSIIKRNLSDSDSKNVETNDEKLVKKSFETKFKEYKDEDSEVILDISEEIMDNKEKEVVYNEMIEEMDEEFYLYQNKKSKSKLNESNLKRGETGVFDIEELVELLRSEKMKDTAVIQVPQHLKYCDFLVLANATSQRHLKAFIEYFNKVYKMKKYRKDPFLVFGDENCNDWKVIDMKNIVLHLFMKETRDYYDIETLWTVGEEFDDKTQRPEVDIAVDLMEKHIKFLKEMKPSI